MQSKVIENTSGEKLDVTFHPGAKRDYLIVLGHGVTGNKDRPLLVALAEGLSARGWPCMRISFSGNGNSSGRFEDATITKEVGDLRAILDAVPDWVQVIYAGHSMGSAVGVLTAAIDLRIRALISLAGMSKPVEFYEREFDSLVPGKDCMWDEPDCPLSQALADDMKSIGSVLPAATSVTQPWFLIHGSADDLVPVQDGKDAYSAAVCRKQWLEIDGAGHSFDEMSYPRIIDVIDGWLRAHFG
jgi:uncharacterized protein